MDIFYGVLLIIGLIILVIGLFRVIFAPYTVFVNFIMEMFLIDWLMDLIIIVLDSLAEIIGD